MLKCTVKDRFMKGEKFVAIIAEATSFYSRTGGSIRGRGRSTNAGCCWQSC